MSNDVLSKLRKKKTLPETTEYYEKGEITFYCELFWFGSQCTVIYKRVYMIIKIHHCMKWIFSSIIYLWIYIYIYMYIYILNRNNWRGIIRIGSAKIENRKIQNPEPKRALHNSSVNLPGGLENLEFKFSHRHQLWKSGYTRYVKFSCKSKEQETYELSLPPRPHGNACTVCGKWATGIKRFIKIHQNYIPLVNSENLA